MPKSEKEKKNKNQISTPYSSTTKLKMTIKFYEAKDKEFGFLSNFYGTPNSKSFKLNIDGINYKSTEHYYQSEKFKGEKASKESLVYAKVIEQQNTCGKVSFLGRQKTNGYYPWMKPLAELSKKSIKYGVTIRPDWDSVKDSVMQKAVESKFQQNDDLKQKLIKTAGCKLYEHTSRDTYWGDGGTKGGGKNKLGNLLEVIREKLIVEDEEEPGICKECNHECNYFNEKTKLCCRCSYNHDYVCEYCVKYSPFY